MTEEYIIQCIGALKLTQIMWVWLAENGERHKMSYVRINPYNVKLPTKAYNCYLCGIVPSDYQGKMDCEQCALAEHFKAGEAGEAGDFHGCFCENCENDSYHAYNRGSLLNTDCYECREEAAGNLARSCEKRIQELEKLI